MCECARSKRASVCVCVCIVNCVACHNTWRFDYYSELHSLRAFCAAETVRTTPVSIRLGSNPNTAPVWT